jgi:hypothetical protein
MVDAQPRVTIAFFYQPRWLWHEGFAEAGANRRRSRALVVISARGSSCLGAYRYIYSQLRIATDFQKILMLFGDGRVGILTG